MAKKRSSAPRDEKEQPSTLPRTQWEGEPLWKKVLINLFLVTLIPSFFLDSFPSVGPFEWVYRYQYQIRPYLARIGLWQERWELFAPYPIDERCRVSARLEYENGEAYEWSSPRWSQLSLFTKKRLFRIQEYMDGIRSDDHVLLHFPLVEYIARTNPIHVEYPYGRPQQLYPKRVVLSGHQTLIYPPPEDYDSRIQPGFHWLLGNPVKDTLGEETSEELYWWTVPDNYDFRSKRPVPPIHGSTLTKLPSSTTRPQIDDSQEDPGSDGPTDGWQMDDD